MMRSRGQPRSSDAAAGLLRGSGVRQGPEPIRLTLETSRRESVKLPFGFVGVRRVESRLREQYIRARRVDGRQQRGGLSDGFVNG